MIDVTLNGTFKEAVLEQIGGLETHGEPLEIMGDDEKVVVWMRPCGSGQFLQETRHVCEAPQKCVLCKACPQTWNIDNFPVYCVHAPRQEILSIKQIGWLVMVNCPLPEERDVPGYMFAKQSCGFAVYKDPNDIPEFVYKTLGFEKPAHVEKPAKWQQLHREITLAPREDEDLRIWQGFIDRCLICAGPALNDRQSKTEERKRGARSLPRT